MSNAKEELREALRQTVDETLMKTPMLETVPETARRVTSAVIEALTLNEVTAGWLITGSHVRKVEETDLTDPGDENWTYIAYCEPPEGDED